MISFIKKFKPIEIQVLAIIILCVLVIIHKAWGRIMENGLKHDIDFIEIHKLHVHGYINSIAWSADGSRLAALSDSGGTITVWEKSKWRVVNEFHRYGGAYCFNSLAFLRDNSILTSAPLGDYSQDLRYANTILTDPNYKSLDIFSLIRWNPETGRVLNYIPDLGYPPRDLSTKITNTFTLSRDEKLVAGILKKDVVIYDIDKRIALITIKNPLIGSGARLINSKKVPKTVMDSAASVAFSPDNKIIAVGTLSGKLNFFNVQNGSIFKTIDAFPETFGSGCISLSFNNDGSLIATGRAAVGVGKKDIGLVRVWRVSDGKMLFAYLGSTGSVRTLSWHPTGKILAAGDDSTLSLWNANDQTNDPVLTRKFPLGIYSASFSTEGILAVASSNIVVLFQNISK